MMFIKKKKLFKCQIRVITKLPNTEYKYNEYKEIKCQCPVPLFYRRYISIALRQINSEQKKQDHFTCKNNAALDVNRGIIDNF